MAKEIISNTTRGKAAVLAIGTAVPPNFIYQSDYSEYYFHATKSEHLTELQQKLTRICIGTKIRKRHFILTDEMLNNHPNIATHKEQSLDARNNLLMSGVQELAMEAADVALAEWGQPRSKITHLVFHTATGCVNLPGPDFQLAKRLGLSNKVNRCMFFHNGCYAGGTLLRVAKDIVENNPGARVLAICSESALSFYRGPSATAMDTLVAQALFGDGAGAIIVGSDPDLSVEQPLYEIVSASQAFIPDTADTLGGCVTEAGFFMFLSRTVPFHISNSVQQCVSEAFAPLGITDFNSLFWIVHPGGQKILDGIETELKLDKVKMMPTRHVLTEYGNVMSGGVFFVMEEMRKLSVNNEKRTTGEGAEFGVLLGFGPGLTVETVVLKAFEISPI